MPHLFISYAKVDTRELALSLSDKLNAIDGITAWVDRSLRAGKSWELQIQISSPFPAQHSREGLG